MQQRDEGGSWTQTTQSGLF